MSVAAKRAPAKNDPVRVAYKKIRLRPQRPDVGDAIAKTHTLSTIAGNVLAARGFHLGSELDRYINPTLKDGLPDPWTLKNLEQGARRIAESVERGEAIAICCDFDVDGLSGGAQVFHFLSSLGVRTEAFVPDRFSDGYGLNERIVREIASKGFSLLITIDFGTTNLKELACARELGVSTVVIDHHHVGTIENPADVFINPNQNGCGFAGRVMSASGLAWYLLLGLKRAIPRAKDIDVRSYLDLACLGTICDMVPLSGVNRVIAKRGLEHLTTTKRVGLVAIKNVIGLHKNVNCHDVSFGIGPRLNAAGRMIHGELVIELLTTSDSDNASRLATRLNKLNIERQDTENDVKGRAIRKVEECEALKAGLVVADDSFHTGVVGIVAQRLVETFYRPSVVLGIDSPGIFKGSVRGVKGFNVVDALSSFGHLLIKFGGHEGAGGLSVAAENLHAFESAWVKECEKRLKGFDLSPYADADTEAGLAELDPDIIDELNSFSPFGMGNPTPLLVTRGLKVLDVRDLKGAHLKATFTDGTRYLPGLMWRTTFHPALEIGGTVDIAYRLDRNTFNGTTELQANLHAVERSGKGPLRQSRDTRG